MADLDDWAFKPRGQRRLLYTSDPSNLAFYEAGRHLAHIPDAEQARGDPARPEDLIGWVDELAHAGIDGYAQAVFAQGWTLFFRSENFEYDARPQHQRFAAMLDSGTSPLEVLIEHTHERGMEFIAKFRMNDTHGSGSQGAGFVLENKQWWIPGRPGALDYGVEEVREFMFAVADEVVSRFDVDGLLFNFIRHMHVFPLEVAFKCHPLMTEFLRRVREMLDRYGRDRQKTLSLGAMVPQTLEECLALGYDIPTWTREGLVDYVCPCDFHCADFNAPYEEFSELTRASDCLLYPVLTPLLCRNDQVSLNRPESYRTMAQNFYGAGADGLSVFNYQYHWARRGGTAEYPGPVEGLSLGLSYLRGLKDPRDISGQVRHYRFHPLWGGPSVTGFEKNDRVVLQRQAGANGKYRFRVCGSLADGDRANLYCTAQGLLPGDEIRVDLNGTAVGNLQRVFHREGRLEKFGRPLPAFSTVFFELDRLSLTDRDNYLGMTLTKCAPEAEEEIVIDEVEVVVVPCSNTYTRRNCANEPPRRKRRGIGENIFSTTVLTDANPLSACPGPKHISPPSPNSLFPLPFPRSTLNSRNSLPIVPSLASAPF